MKTIHRFNSVTSQEGLNDVLRNKVHIEKGIKRQRMEIAKFSWNVIKTGMIKETKHFSRVNAFRAVFTENRKPRLAR